MSVRRHPRLPLGCSWGRAGAKTSAAHVADLTAQGGPSRMIRAAGVLLCRAFSGAAELLRPVDLRLSCQLLGWCRLGSCSVVSEGFLACRFSTVCVGHLGLCSEVSQANGLLACRVQGQAAVKHWARRVPHSKDSLASRCHCMHLPLHCCLTNATCDSRDLAPRSKAPCLQPVLGALVAIQGSEFSEMGPCGWQRGSPLHSAAPKQ